MKYLVLFGLITVMACSRNRDTYPDFVYAETDVESTSGPTTATLNVPVDIEVTFRITGGCGAFDKFTSAAIPGESATRVGVWEKRARNTDCNKSIVYSKATFRFVPAARGRHQLRFKSPKPAANYVHVHEIVVN